MAHFDHPHNLPLQFAVELGVPLALLVIALPGWALVAALRYAVADGRSAVTSDATCKTPTLRAAFMIVLMVMLHSLLEYPLWYLYFLLPTVFALSPCLGRPVAVPAGLAAPRTERTRPLLLVSMLLVYAGLASMYDYLRVVDIFVQPDKTVTLAQRIDRGSDSWLFAHRADFAAATLTQPPTGDMRPIQRVSHYLLDPVLMMAWAHALDKAGDVERARYIAQRLKEFHSEQATEFFAPCERLAGPEKALPFQCSPPSRDFSYTDFR